MTGFCWEPKSFRLLTRAMNFVARMAGASDSSVFSLGRHACAPLKGDWLVVIPLPETVTIRECPEAFICYRRGKTACAQGARLKTFMPACRMSLRRQDKEASRDMRFCCMQSSQGGEPQVPPNPRLGGTFGDVPKPLAKPQQALSFWVCGS